MKIVRFTNGFTTEYGIIDGDMIQALSGSPFESYTITHKFYRPTDVKILPPCLPSKIVALGVNYKSHGEEMSHNIPTEPLIFLKPPTTVIGHEDTIIYPPSSKRVDYEGELGVIISATARNVSKEKAKNFILGYTCVKSFDTFAPVGPWVETELDPTNLALETRLNGKVKQKTNTSELIFDVFKLVSFVSEVMTLLPGDVIATGTTAGIGPMQPGDIVEVEIENIGILRNYVARPE